VKVVVSDNAEQELREIGRYIARDNPKRAVSFVMELRDRCLSIIDKPSGYPVAFDFGETTIRKRSFKKYLILYRVSNSPIEIASVVHSARDWTKSFESIT
jgi:toxin ParE1/3/4